MLKKNLKFFHKANTMASQSTYPKLQIGSIIVLGNRVLSSGVNMLKTHTKQKKYAVYRFDHQDDIDGDQGRCHAEMDAIIKAGRLSLQGTSIYIFRKDAHGNLANSKPCGACMQAIKDKGIKHVYFTSSDGYNHLEITQ